MRTRLLLALVISLTVSFAEAQNKKKPRLDRKAEAALQAKNAARIDKGGRISLEVLDKKVVKDKQTSPEAVVDGNVHSRQVMTGTPYRFRITLVDELPIEQINFIGSDYASEQTPKDIEVKLSDGTAYKKTLENTHATRNGPRPRQSIDVGGKKIKWVEVTVLNNHPGKVKWGGIGEIEVITNTDLTPYLTVSDFHPNLPKDVRSNPPRADYSNIKATLPKPIPLGTRPGIYMTADELKDMFKRMKETERGRKLLDATIGMANAYLKQPVTFPDPKIPAQIKSRGDAPAKAHDLLAKKVGVCGWVYQITGDEKYAKLARDILVGYAERYPNDYKEHKGVNGNDSSKVMAQRLSESMWLLPLIQGYDMVANSKAFSDADRKRVEEDLIRTAITFINSKRPAAAEVVQKDKANPNWRTDPAPKKTRKGALGNWTNFYNQAFIQGGIVLGDQDWIDLGAANTKYMIENGIGEDGMWGEGAIGYQQFARHALVGCMESLARKGIDLWSYKNNAFKNLFDSEFKYAYPDSTSPGINDSGRRAVGSGWTAMAFDYAYMRYGDPNYARTVNSAGRQLHQSSACYFPTQLYKPLPQKTVQGQESLVFDKLGYAILRGKEGGKETFMLMDYGPHGGVHGHPDKLNLILFADEDELAGEPQFYRYEDARHGEWTKTSVGHWVISVDEQSQKASEGKLLVFADDGDVKVMRGRVLGAFAGVAFDRTVVQMPGYIVDIYRAWGPAEHTFDYPLCFRGNLNVLAGVDAGSLKPMGNPQAKGYKHILAKGPEKVTKPWVGLWTRPKAAPNPEGETTDEKHGSPGNEVKAIVLGGKGMEAFFGKVPGGREQAIFRVKAKDATFISVIDPFKKSDVVKSVERTEVPGVSTTVTVTRTDGKKDVIMVRYDMKADGTFPKTSARSQISPGLVTVMPDFQPKRNKVYLYGPEKKVQAAEAAEKK